MCYQRQWEDVLFVEYLYKKYKKAQTLEQFGYIKLASTWPKSKKKKQEANTMLGTIYNTITYNTEIKENKTSPTHILTKALALWTPTRKKHEWDQDPVS